MNQDNIPICKNCRYFIPVYYQCAKLKKFNPVAGYDELTCEVARSSGDCGPAGSLFEPIPRPPKKTVIGWFRQKFQRNRK